MDALSTFAAVLEPTWLAPLFALVAAHFVAEPLRWHLYVRGEGPSGWLRLFQIFSLTAFITFTMPLKVGLPTRVLLLRIRAGLGLARITSLMVMDGLVYYGLWAGAALLGFAAFAGALELSPRVRALLGLAVGLLAVAGAGWLWWLRRADGAGATGFAGRVQEKLAAFRAAALETGRGAIAAAALVGAADIASHVLRHGALLATFGYGLGWPELYVVTTVSVFAGLASLMPMGLGGYDVVLVLLLGQLGVPAEAAIGVAVLNRTATVVTGCVLGIWGGFALGLDPFRRAWLQRSADRS